MPAPERVAPEPRQPQPPPAAAWSVAALITLAAAISVLLSKTVAGATLPLRGRARRRSPRITTQVRNRGALAPGLMRIG